MKTKHTDFTLQIPDAEGKVVRRVKVKVPVEWDEAIGEWMMTPEALRMVEDAKAREMGIIMPDEMKALRKRFGLTQAQMGALFQVGGKSWTRWESGKYRPSRVISLLVRAVADGHLSADYLRGKPPGVSSRPAAPVFSSAWSRMDALHAELEASSYAFADNIIHCVQDLSEGALREYAA
jgi:DNA-binding transcriptional regulator YiaG